MAPTGQASAFTALRWVSELPLIRTAKGHVDHELKLVAFALALHADGETGENSYPGLDRIAREADLSGKKEAAQVLARGEAMGLWERGPEESEWGTATWHLNVGDEGLIHRLVKVEEAREEAKRANRAARNERYYVRRSTGRLKTPSTPSEDALHPVLKPSPVRRHEPRLKTPTTPSSDTVQPVLRHSPARLKTGPRPTNQPTNQPDVPARVQPAHVQPAPLASPPGDPTTTEQSESRPILYNFDDDDPVMPPSATRSKSTPRTKPNTPRRPRTSYAYTPDFEDAWNRYGRRGAKQEAFREWRAALDRGMNPQTILDAIQPYLDSCSEPQYVRHMQRWLRDDGWDQEFTPVKKPFVAGSDARPHHEYLDNLKDRPVKTLLKHSIGPDADVCLTWYYHWNHEHQRDWTVEQIQERVEVEEHARWLHDAYRHGIDPALYDRLREYFTFD